METYKGQGAYIARTAVVVGEVENDTILTTK